MKAGRTTRLHEEASPSIDIRPVVTIRRIRPVAVVIGISVVVRIRIVSVRIVIRPISVIASAAERLNCRHVTWRQRHNIVAGRDAGNRIWCRGVCLSDPDRDQKYRNCQQHQDFSGVHVIPPTNWFLSAGSEIYPPFKLKIFTNLWAARWKPFSGKEGFTVPRDAGCAENAEEKWCTPDHAGHWPTLRRT